MNDPRIRSFMSKVTHAVNPKSEEMRHQDLVVDQLPYLSHRPARVEVTARGKTFDCTVDYARWLSIGVEEFRATDAGLAEKFRANAEGVLGDGTISEVIDSILSLERVSDTSRVAEMLAS